MPRMALVEKSLKFRDGGWQLGRRLIEGVETIRRQTCGNRIGRAEKVASRGHLRVVQLHFRSGR